jgi:DNA-binding LytR/AlgR family response regulator
VKAGLATFVAVTFVHLFAGPIEPVGAFALHALVITGVYTAAFALTYLVLQRVRAAPLIAVLPIPVLVALWSAIACLLGAALLAAMKSASEPLAGVIDVHNDANWALKLLPLWLVMTGVLYQTERTRVLESELRRLSASRAKSRADSVAHVARAPGKTLEIGNGKSAKSVSAADIAYFMAVENYCEVHFTPEAERKALLVRATLASIAERLPSDFVRTHRSYVFNLAVVESIGRAGRAYAAGLADGRTIPISRAAADQVSARWRAFLDGGAAEHTRPA